MHSLYGGVFKDEGNEWRIGGLHIIWSVYAGEVAVNWDYEIPVRTYKESQILSVNTHIHLRKVSTIIQQELDPDL